MFNISGTEIIVILLLALVVLGPEKLPDAMRKAGRAYAELKRMSSNFQSEMHDALDEPMKEMRDTADMLRNAATFDPKKAAVKAVTKPTPKPATPTPDGPADGIDAADDDDLITRTLSGGDASNPPPSTDGDIAVDADTPTDEPGTPDGASAADGDVPDESDTTVEGDGAARA